jgi:hypothetical protein
MGPRFGWEQPKVYGGVGIDCEEIHQIVSKRSLPDRDDPKPYGHGCKPFTDPGLNLLFYTVDLPLSAVGDTLTLPYILPFALGWRTWDTTPVDTNTAHGVELPPPGSSLDEKGSPERKEVRAE